jgi:NodT family efflux transporter outer membrane factor (OMF) lipoprotein
MTDEWTGEKAPEIAEAPVTKWWEVFEDPLLNKYIAAAEKNNYDVLTAEANILRARALRQVTASSLFPQVSANFIPMRIDLSKTGPFFNGVEEIGALLPFSRVFNLFSAFFDASWELDLFGKTRRAVQQADAMIDSAIEQKNGTLISTFAELARNYMELRSFQAQKQLVEENIALYEENVYIICKSYDAGYSNLLELENSEAKLETAKAALPEIIAEIYRSIYTISILTGEMPEKLLDELKVAQALPKVPEKIAVGLRSDLLRRRPDVRRAERDLAAATANVGVAVASFFPTVTLFGLAGFQSIKIPELFDWKSKAWAYGADFSMPVYQGGKIVGNLRFTQAEESAAAFTYQQVVLNAIQGAESSLVAYKQQLAAAADFSRAVCNNEHAVDISTERFVKGLVNKIELLNSEMELVQAKLNSLSSDTSSLISLISLYKALGGGWEIAEGS